MNTHVEHGTIRSVRFSIINSLNAMLRAWRIQRLERAQIEALEALGPEVLDDIGVRIVKDGMPPRSAVVSHPYVVAANAFGASTKRGEI